MNENEIRSLCKYWLKTFKAASLKSVALKKGVKFVQIDIADLERPLDNTKFNKLGFRYPNNEMNVILILKSYITKDNTNFKTACLCTNAQVAPKTHKLELSNYPNFWIPYDVLEVNHEIDPCFFVGTLDNYLALSNEIEAEIRDVNNVRELVVSANTFFKKFNKKYTNRDTFVNVEIDSEHIYIVNDENVINKDAIHFYSSLIDGSSRNHIDSFAYFNNKTNSPVIDENHETEEVFDWEGAKMNAAHVSQDYSLLESQRIALYEYLKNGDIAPTVISGPPGTGKTTLIQSVVANEVVHHALDNKKAPIIIGCSHTNQAVQNILDAFSKCSNCKDGFFSRWIPDVDMKSKTLREEPSNSIGIYFSSKSKLEEALNRGRLVEDIRTKNQLYPIYTIKENRKKVVDFFDGKFISNCGRCHSGLSTKEFLHSYLKKLERFKKSVLRECKLLNNHKWIKRFFGKLICLFYGKRFAKLCANHIDCKNHGFCFEVLIDPDKLDILLDKTIRCLEFWTAVHYYEACWVSNEDVPIVEEDELGDDSEIILRQFVENITQLFPVFVRTLFTLPSLLIADNKYLFDYADLIIVDEAGQIETPLGAISLFLSKKNLIVGDEKQLKPIWNFKKEHDSKLFMSCNIENDLRKNFLTLKQIGATDSNPSSFMKFCSNQNLKTSNNELMLLEHFRCHEEIMNCFNAFMYGNKLQPCRQKENILVPSLFNSSVNYSIVSNSRSTQVNASRTNEIEADAVIEFLKYIANTIIGAYETKDGKQITIDKIFAILTPFRAQARLIKTKLLKEFKQYPKIENMTVDTIHSLQGAERPVILYSTVYGDNDSNCRFIDDNKELSNVVMSRAQDLLVVFCAKKQLNNSASDFFKIIKKSGEALD